MTYAFADAGGYPEGGEFNLTASYGPITAGISKGLIHLGVGVEGYWDKVFTSRGIQDDKAELEAPGSSAGAAITTIISFYF